MVAGNYGSSYHQVIRDHVDFCAGVVIHSSDPDSPLVRSVDLSLINTYYMVEHFHYIVLSPIAFASFTAMYY